MNFTKLKDSAIRLESLLVKYSAVDADANNLLAALKPLISNVYAGNITSPLEWSDVPGDYFFDEKNLRRFSDLESGYAKFKIEITGGETPALAALKADMAQKQ